MRVSFDVEVETGLALDHLEVAAAAASEAAARTLLSWPGVRSASVTSNFVAGQNDSHSQLAEPADEPA